MLWWELGLVSRHVGDEFTPTSLHCPYCGNLGRFVRIFRSEKRESDPRGDHFSDVWQCQACSEKSFIQWHGENNMVDYRVYPQGIRHGLKDVLPTDIGVEYQQAIEAFTSENWDVCVVLLKRLIDLVAQQFDINEQGLQKVLAKLVDEGKLTRDVQAWADEIELLDPEGSKKTATIDSAREMLTFTRWVLDLIYLLPQTRARYRE